MEYRALRRRRTSQEGFIAVTGGEVWCRVTGSGPGLPLVCLHGGPGFPGESFEPLEELGDERPVVRYDQLGCGRSTAPDDVDLWTVDRFVSEISAVVTALDFTAFHLLGHSWGGMLAMQHCLDAPRKPASVILSSSPASMPRWRDVTEMRLHELPPEEVAEIDRLHAIGETEGLAYEVATAAFERRFLCRIDPRPVALRRSGATANLAIYRHMIGPSEFRIEGTLRDWDVMPRLGAIGIPALICGGEFDECHPIHLREVHERIPGSELQIIEGASHMPMFEQPDVYVGLIRSFLARVERA